MPYKEISGTGGGISSTHAAINDGSWNTTRTVSLTSDLSTASMITVGDCLAAGLLGINMLAELTSQGLDYAGAPFTPYATTRPYYWNPSKYYGDTGTNRSRKTRQAFTLHNKRYYGGERKRGGETIKFENYAAFHAAVAGTDSVTLSLLLHRLYDNLEVQAGGQSMHASSGTVPDANAYGEPTTEFTYGIFEPEDAVMIGTAHNEGLGNNPRREFMNISEENEEKIIGHIAERVMRRLVDLGENVSRTN